MLGYSLPVCRRESRAQGRQPTDTRGPAEGGLDSQWPSEGTRADGPWREGQHGFRWRRKSSLFPRGPTAVGFQLELRGGLHICLLRWFHEMKEPQPALSFVYIPNNTTLRAALEFGTELAGSSFTGGVEEPLPDPAQHAPSFQAQRPQKQRMSCSLVNSGYTQV